MGVSSAKGLVGVCINDHPACIRSRMSGASPSMRNLDVRVFHSVLAFIPNTLSFEAGTRNGLDG